MPSSGLSGILNVLTFPYLHSSPPHQGILHKAARMSSYHHQEFGLNVLQNLPSPLYKIPALARDQRGLDSS
jgi:hypothetical protein